MFTGEGDQRTAVENDAQNTVVQPEVQPEPAIPQQPDYEQNAILAAKEEARRNKEVADFYRELYSKQVVPQQQPQQQQSGFELNIADDEIVDGAIMRNILESQKREIESLREAIERASIEATAERMKATIPDFEESFNLGMEVLNTYPEFQYAIKATGDKVKFVYNLAKHHPAYKTPPTANKIEQTLQNISNNVQKPATLSGVPGSSGALGGIKQMDQKDFEKLMQDVLNGN